MNIVNKIKYIILLIHVKAAVYGNVEDWEDPGLKAEIYKIKESNNRIYIENDEYKDFNQNDLMRFVRNNADLEYYYDNTNGRTNLPIPKGLQRVLVKRIVPHGQEHEGVEYDHKYNTYYNPLVRIHKTKKVEKGNDYYDNLNDLEINLKGGKMDKNVVFALNSKQRKDRNGLNKAKNDGDHKYLLQHINVNVNKNLREPFLKHNKSKNHIKRKNYKLFNENEYNSEAPQSPSLQKEMHKNAKELEVFSKLHEKLRASLEEVKSAREPFKENRDQSQASLKIVYLKLPNYKYEDQFRSKNYHYNGELKGPIRNVTERPKPTYADLAIKLIKLIDTNVESPKLKRKLLAQLFSILAEIEREGNIGRHYKRDQKPKVMKFTNIEDLVEILNLVKREKLSKNRAKERNPFMRSSKKSKKRKHRSDDSDSGSEDSEASDRSSKKKKKRSKPSGSKDEIYTDLSKTLGEVNELKREIKNILKAASKHMRRPLLRVPNEDLENLLKQVKESVNELNPEDIEDKVVQYVAHRPIWNKWTYKKTIPDDECPGEQVKIGNVCSALPPH